MVLLIIYLNNILIIIFVFFLATIVPNLRYDSTKGMTYLFVKDLGFSDDYVSSSSSGLYFRMDIPSISYYASSTSPPLGYYIDLTFRISSRVYRVSSNPLPPQIKNISIVNDLVIIGGAYFSYNVSTISIDIGGYNVMFYHQHFMKLIADWLWWNQVYHQLYHYHIVILMVLASWNERCICDSKHSGASCLEINCTKACTSNEYCDLSIGECKCSSGWLGENCLIANHYSSSVSQIGNSISFYGWFGKIHNDLFIKIGVVNSTTMTACINITTTDKIINCTLSNKPNNGFQNGYINQNWIEWIGKNLFKYQEEIQTISCYQNCSGNGKCNTLIGHVHVIKVLQV